MSIIMATNMAMLTSTTNTTTTTWMRRKIPAPGVPPALRKVAFQNEPETGSIANRRNKTMRGDDERKCMRFGANCRKNRTIHCVLNSESVNHVRNSSWVVSRGTVAPHFLQPLTVSRWQSSAAPWLPPRYSKCVQRCVLAAAVLGATTLIRSGSTMTLEETCAPVGFDLLVAPTVFLLMAWKP